MTSDLHVTFSGLPDQSIWRSLLMRQVNVQNMPENARRPDTDYNFDRETLRAANYGWLLLSTLRPNRPGAAPLHERQRSLTIISNMIEWTGILEVMPQRPRGLSAPAEDGGYTGRYTIAADGDIVITDDIYENSASVRTYASVDPNGGPDWGVPAVG